MADNSTNSSDEQAEFHRKMWLALAPLEVEEHQNTTDESPQQLDISRYPATTDDPVILDSSNIISSDEAEFRRKAWLALAPLYEPTTLDSNCAENNMIEDTKKVEQGDHLRPDESLSDLQRPVISSGRVASGCSPSLAARSSSIEGSLKGSQKRKAGDMDRPSQRHYSYPQPPDASMLLYRHQIGPPPQGGFYPHTPPGDLMSNFPPSNRRQIFLHLVNTRMLHRVNAPGQPEKTNCTDKTSSQPR